jgi:TBC1 domain family member 15
MQLCFSPLIRPPCSWVLIAFKREFPFEDVLRLWEVLWTNYYSNEFILFVALAILESHRDVILRYLVEV